MGCEQRRGGFDERVDSMAEGMSPEHGPPSLLGQRQPFVRMRKIVVDPVQQLRAVTERRDRAIELFVDPRHGLGDHERPGGQGVVHAIGDEALVAHVGIRVVEHDVGTQVMTPQAIVRDPLAAKVAEVQQVGRPVPAVDGEVVGRPREGVEDRPATMPRVADEQELVRRTTLLRIEAIRIGRLVERQQWRAVVTEPATKVAEELIRCDRDEVIRQAHLPRDHVGVADDPKDRCLPWPDDRRADAEHVEGKVGPDRRGAVAL